MNSLPIVTGKENPFLHQKTKKVKFPLSEDVQNLIPVMFESMRTAKGIGLAAPQIASLLRLAVIDVDGERCTLFNPKITSFSKEKVLSEEGCLSIPGEHFLIERSERITVRYENEGGQEVKQRASGLFAIVIQHEIDHLDGILIFDRFKSQKQRNRHTRSVSPRHV